MMIRPSVLRRGAAALALLLASSAAAGAQDAPAFTVRDSAGIPIAESTRPAWGESQGWTVGETPLLEFPIESRGPSIIRLPDGRIAVPIHEHLLFYQPDGSRADSVRLRPEDEWVWWIGLGAGDSIMAVTREAQLYVFTPGGRLARRARAQGLDYIFPYVIGRLPDGRLLASEGHQERGDSIVPRRRVVRHLFLGPDGRGRGVFAALPDVARMRGSVVPFSWRAVVAVRGDDVLVGDNRRFGFAVYAPDGTPRLLVRRPYTPRPVHPEDVEAWIARIGVRTADPSPELQRFNEALRRELRRVPPGDTFPAYSDLLPDAGGNVWAHEARRPDDPQHRWSVFGPEGRWLGTVQMPAGFELKQVGADWVLGTREDAGGDHVVRLYPLHRTPAGPPAAP